MVLILSDNSDISTNLVIDWLKYYEIPWIRINETDKITFSNLEYNNNKLIKLIIEINGNPLDLISISSYWYRRGFLNSTENNPIVVYANNNYMQDRLSEYLNDEKNNIYEFIHSYLKEAKVHLNSYMTSKNDKTYYQFIAAQVGLSIPNTLITSKKIDLLNFERNASNGIITKSINEGFGFNINNLIFFQSTNLVLKTDINNADSFFFPTLFQENMDKFIELRVFYLDEKFYSMAIFSQENPNTQLDFRNYDEIRPNRRVPFSLPIEIEEKIKFFMNKIDLNCGSIDLILNNNGEYVFLEVNPVGQFGMVSDPCNYYLEKKISNYLNHGING